MGKDVTSLNTIELENIRGEILELNKYDIANKTSAGFIFQDLVLMKKLLYLENDSTEIGYEVLDDIHIIKENSIDLIQVKHSINDGTLTESASDFWKTIVKWAKIVEKTNEPNLNFIFYTNKQISTKSNLYNELQDKDYNKIVNYINEIYSKLNQKETSKNKDDASNPIFKYVKYICELDDKYRKILFKKLIFITSDTQIIEEIKERIKFFGINKQQDIENVYEQLLGIITDKRYHLARESKEFIINYNYFRKDLKFDKLLQISKIEEIDFNKYYSFENKYNEDFKNKIFYKQLADIDIEEDVINDYARERAKTSSFLDELDLLNSELNVIDAKIIEEWEDIHDDAYDEGIKNDGIHKVKARTCLKKVQKVKISYKQSDLPKSLVKGKLIDLSNIPIIGWRKDWKEKYGE